MVSQLVTIPLSKYQAVAANRAKKGLRPNMLPCEVGFGEHCSVRFARLAKNASVPAAIADLRTRCPKGVNHTNKALAFSALTALAPLLLSINDPCFPGDPCAADPFSGKDPCSQDLAGCDC